MTFARTLALGVIILLVAVDRGKPGPGFGH